MNFDDVKINGWDKLLYPNVPHTFQEQLKVIRKLQTMTLLKIHGLNNLEEQVTKNKTLTDKETKWLQIMMIEIIIYDVYNLLDIDIW
ncbi:MAG: hypothetical protein ACREAK_12120 [Nitrosarchaeum sp.]